MKYLVVYAHPRPESFNHAVLERVTALLEERGREYVVHDLYALGFEPRLDAEGLEGYMAGKVPPDVAAEQAAIAAADRLLVIHPTWWFGMPAILKGWIDRVFVHGFAFRYGEKGPEGLLAGKQAIVVTTTGGGEEAYRNHGFGDAIRKAIDTGIFGFCGMELLERRFLFGVPAVDDAARTAMLDALSTLPL
ncbi:MAG: NAD(P)H-dependent oxidoreductase [Candidatus Krumholzibacteriota bacterium]|nr:NAD(P)H-dependent oxidoreductase [Candidatus Krumholzibacteriota bacterium]